MGSASKLSPWCESPSKYFSSEDIAFKPFSHCTIFLNLYLADRLQFSGWCCLWFNLSSISDGRVGGVEDVLINPDLFTMNVYSRLSAWKVDFHVNMSGAGASALSGFMPSESCSAWSCQLSPADSTAWWQAPDQDTDLTNNKHSNLSLSDQSSGQIK